MTAAMLLGGCGNAVQPETPAIELTDTQTEGSDAVTGDTIFNYDPFPGKIAESTEFTISANMTAKLSAFDQLEDFDQTNCFVIKLNENDVDISVGLNGNTLDAATETNRIAQSVNIEDNRICITREGTYVLEGTLSNGQICVDASDTSKVQLVLNGVQINCANSAAILIQNADKALITIAEGTDNVISDTSRHDDETIKGCIYSTCDLTINGNGNLNVDGSYNNGISCKDDLKIVGGNITVNAINNGLKGNDSIAIYDGNITVTAIGDGIKTDSSNEGKGYLYFYDGVVTVTADDDALQAVSAIVVRDCQINARAYDAIFNCEGLLDGVEKISEIK